MTPATTAPLLRVRGLSKHYVLPGSRPFKALDAVSFDLHGRRTLGIVGESGCGKSTLGRTLMRLLDASAGTVTFGGVDWISPSAKPLREHRRWMQMVFQDPFSSLDPKHTVGAVVREPLDIHWVDRSRAQRMQRVYELLATVGLAQGDADKYPHEFSGGQRQRIAIARALITRPRLIVADEPVSALDVSVQAQVLNLMQDLQQQFGVTYLLISHDLAVVDHLCAEVAVIFQGRIVEQGTPATLFHHAAHPYTRALMDAVPRMEPRRPDQARRRTLSLAPRPQLPGACPYAHRCPNAQALCDSSRPELLASGPDHLVACHFPQTAPLPTRGD